MKAPLLSLVIAFALNSPIFGGEQRVRVEFSIAPSQEADTSGRRTLLKRTEKTKFTAGVDIALVARPGKSFKAYKFTDFIAPTQFSPPEILGDPKCVNREDGSILVVSSEKGDASVVFDGRSQKVDSFPVSPARPTAFEAWNIGWEIEGTPILSEDGLVILDAEIRHHGARVATARYGEGTGPIVTKGKTALGREVEIILTENKKQTASTSVTLTPLVLRARPGVTYPIEVMIGNKAVAATIRCTVVEPSS